jgi:hypothetical protein
VADSDSHTVIDKLLVAAYSLDGGEGRHFTAEELVVAAWQHFPRAFGLRGHNDATGLPLYPDSNRVFAEIMGSKPIRKRGFLTKTGTKLYGLTGSGRAEAVRISRGMENAPEGAEGPKTAGKATISRSVRGRLERLLGSRAVQRVQTGQADRITFHDACVFWGITARSSSIELEGALSDTSAAITAADNALKSGASELRTGKEDLSRATAEILRSLHDDLQEKFAVELATIRRRTDERKT